MADVAAFAAPWLLLLAASWRWAGWFDSNSKARRGGSRPGLISDPDKDKMMWTLPDGEGEALPPWPGPYCASCVEGACDRAEHLGLTDADMPRGR